MGRATLFRRSRFVPPKSGLIFSRESNIRGYSCKHLEPAKITGGSSGPAGLCIFPNLKIFACEVFSASRGSLVEDRRAVVGGEGRGAVYNKAQYPRISLSCIFNDFLGDFGRSP